MIWGFSWRPKEIFKTDLQKYKRRSVGKLISRFNQPSPPCLSGNKLGLETDPVRTSPFVNVQTLKFKIVTTFWFLGVGKKTVSHCLKAFETKLRFSISVSKLWWAWLVTKWVSHCHGKTMSGPGSDKNATIHLSFQFAIHNWNTFAALTALCCNLMFSLCLIVHCVSATQLRVSATSSCVWGVCGAPSNLLLHSDRRLSLFANHAKHTKYFLLPRPLPPKKCSSFLFSSRWIQPLYPIFAVTLVFALRWSLGLFPKKLSKSIWAPPTVGEHREFWLLKTSLIFQVISWDLDVNVLKHITMKILL